MLREQVNTLRQENSMVHATVDELSAQAQITVEYLMDAVNQDMHLEVANELLLKELVLLKKATNEVQEPHKY